MRIGDLQNYIATRPGSSATVELSAAALKSLFAFAQEVGYLRFNVGAAVKVPPIKNTLAERIMPEGDALLMIRQEPALRNRVLLTVLYGGGLRISEVCGLRWRDLAPRDEAGQVTIFGKDGKTRMVLLSAATWKVLQALREAAPANEPVFRSREGGALDPSAVHRVVKAAAARAGLSADVSAHWLRHAHASHAAPPSTLYKPRSATHLRQRRAGISMLGHRRVRRGSWGSNDASRSRSDPGVAAAPRELRSCPQRDDTDLTAILDRAE